MTRINRLSRGRRALASLGVWAVIGLIAWLDSDRCVLALRPGLELHAAHVFGAIISGIQLLAGWLATAATVTVTYLAQAVSFLAARVWTLLKSTGAMFAKVWDASKVVWSDVLKPALKWLDTQISRLHAWLKDTLAPVFKFLERVRTELQAIYKRFVRPIIDTIEFIRAINRTLQVFHVKVLQKLDEVLQKIEQRIEEPFFWIYTRLSQIQNFLDQILTLGGFFQRVTLIRSLERYWPDWIRIGVNARSQPITPGDYERVKEAFTGRTLSEVRAATEAAILGREGPYKAFVNEFEAAWRKAIEAPELVTGLGGRSS